MRETRHTSNRERLDRKLARLVQSAFLQDRALTVLDRGRHAVKGDCARRKDLAGMRSRKADSGRVREGRVDEGLQAAQGSASKQGASRCDETHLLQ